MPTLTQSVALAALFVSAPGWAQSTQMVDWVVAPSAFLGVDLRGDFMAQVPECVAGDDYPDAPCRVATKHADRFEVRGLPYLPIAPGYKLFASLENGAISQLVLTGNTNNLYLVKELLTDKLGKPTTSGNRSVKLKSGATYKAETFNWSIKGVAIDFGRDLTDIGRYSVTFSTAALGPDADQTDGTQISDIPSL